MEYWGQAFRFARNKTATFSVIKAVPSILIAVALQALYHLNTWARVAVIAAITIAAYFVLFALEFLWKLLLTAPVGIYSEQVKKIQALTPKLSAVELMRRDLVRSKIDAVPPEERPVLNTLLTYLLMHGETPRSQLTRSPTLGPGIAPQQVGTSILQADAAGMLQTRIDPAISIHMELISVKPELQDALGSYLLGE